VKDVLARGAPGPLLRRREAMLDPSEREGEVAA
jgi:hypothetical protein